MGAKYADGLANNVDPDHLLKFISDACECHETAKSGKPELHTIISQL